MKVTKQNFRPKPKVDSRFVKLIPLQEKPLIYIPEYERFLAICFNRKHKLLRNHFHNHSLLTSMVTKQKLNNDLDEIIENLLKDKGYIEKRAVDLRIKDFQNLLDEFHKIGIYFSNSHPDLRKL